MFRYRMVLRVLPRLIKLAIQKDQVRLERNLFDLFVRMGGIYVKFLQIIMTNTKLMQSLTNAQRMSVFSESPPSRVDHIAVLKRQLGSRFNQLKQIEPEPFATGSFANVYKARLDSGKQVIIKLKRPGLEKQLKIDMFILRFVIKIVATVISDRINLKQVAAEYAEGIKREVDYRKEVNNALSLYQEYKDSDDIVVPKTYPALCSKDVIIQDFLDGVLLSDVSKDPENAVQNVVKMLGSDLKLQLSMLGINMLERTFSNRIVHGDPHPGNIMLLTNNRVGFIDFGLLADPPSDQVGYIEYMSEQDLLNRGQFRPGMFALTMLRSYSVRLYHSLEYVDSKFDQVNILDKLEEVTRKRFYKNAHDAEKTIEWMKHGHTTEKFDAVINPDNQLSLDGDFDGLLVRRAFHTVWVSIISLGLYRELIPGIYYEAVKRGRELGEAKNYSGPPRDIEEAFEIIANWLNSLKESDPIFYSSVKNFFPSNLDSSES